MIDPVRAQSSKLVDRSMITRGCLEKRKKKKNQKEEEGEDVTTCILVHLLRLRQQTQKTGTSKCDPWQTPTLFSFCFFLRSFSCLDSLDFAFVWNRYFLSFFLPAWLTVKCIANETSHFNYTKFLSLFPSSFSALY